MSTGETVDLLFGGKKNTFIGNIKLKVIRDYECVCVKAFRQG